MNPTYVLCKGSDELQWETCKKDLMKKVTTKCFPRELKKEKRKDFFI